MNWLSLFDGMSCAQIAAKELGLPIDNYYSSETDKFAIKNTEYNFPDTIHLGDVTKIRAKDLPNIDVIVGGSPCQGFSFAGKQLNFNDPRSKLFFEFVRLVKERKPKYWLLENVVMKKEYIEVISNELGVDPIMINSALVSAQNRKRLYWTNIKTIQDTLFGRPKVNIPQPEDRGIMLVYVLEENCEANYKGAAQRGRYIVDGKRHDHKMRPGGLTNQRIEVRNDFKSNTLTTVTKDFLVAKITNVNPSGNGMNGWVYDINAKSPTLTTNKGEGIKIRDKSKTVRSSSRGSYDRHEWDSVDNLHYRKLTPLECARLQTIPDWYKFIVSNSQQYKMLGNGFTIEVIKHIFSFMEL